MLFFLILVGKLIDIQIIKGDYYRTLSEQNRIRRFPIPAARGKILAANGQPLADNVAVKKKVDFSGSGDDLSLDLTNATKDQIVTDYLRVYPLAEKFAHASGYLGIVSPKEEDKVDPKCPEKGMRKAGSLIGVSGLEEYYDCILRGTDGEQLIEVNTKGEHLRTLAIKNPVHGSDVVTSINSGLQKDIAESFYVPEAGTNKIIQNKKGAVIVTDTEGKVLSFYSGPAFDPNLLIKNAEKIDATGNATLAALFKDPNLPFFNRVMGGTFHPGSVFKPLVAIAALEEGAINSSYVYNDQGVITVNGFSYNNWYFKEYGRMEGQVDLKRALARSTDTFFYKIGELIGPINLAKWSSIFGMDHETNIDLPGEVKGLIPTPEWKKRVKNESWYLGNTYNMAIGQGDVAVTPVEINTYIASLATGGKLCQPSFNLNSEPVCKEISISQSNIDIVTEGMLQACEQGGTGFTFFDFSVINPNVKVACKTGTAEVAADGTPHAWFTFFAPADNPEIIATVLVEKGGQGSSVAGPIARKIADYYFANNSQ